MARYFEQFFVADPMVEISAEEATKRPYYFEQMPGPPLHYRVMSRGRLVEIVYPDQESPEPALRHHRTSYPGTKMYVTSPLRTSDRKQWRQWHFDAAGTLWQLIEYEFALDSPDYRVARLGEDGRVLTWSEHRHDPDGSLREVVSFDAAGNVINRQEAD